MAKTKTGETTSTQTLVRDLPQRFGRFQAEVWDKFEEWLKNRGSKIQPFMDRLIEDVLAGRYINMQQLRPETILELERSAEERGQTLEMFVSTVLSEYATAKMAERKKGPRAVGK